MSAIREIAVRYDSIELDNGENLLDLDLGQAVELRADTKHPGLWVLTGLRDEDGLVRLQAGADIEDCAAAGVGCRFSGTSAHAHPVDVDGQIQPLPVAE
jgi:hypothetical protein